MTDPTTTPTPPADPTHPLTPDEAKNLQQLQHLSDADEPIADARVIERTVLADAFVPGPRLL